MYLWLHGICDSCDSDSINGISTSDFMKFIFHPFRSGEAADWIFFLSYTSTGLLLLNLKQHFSGKLVTQNFIGQLVTKHFFGQLVTKHFFGQLVTAGLSQSEGLATHSQKTSKS